MKAPKFKFSLLLIFVQLVIVFAATAANEKFSKDLHKEYNANSNTLLVIQNKFGDVDINNWDKNKVSIDVTITIEHRNENKAKEMLDYISVSFSESGNTINAITKIDKHFSKWNNGSKEFSIDYKVNIPKNIKLDLNNKYGSVFINEIIGHTKIKVSYGNLKINKILRENKKPLNEIYLAYSNGSIDECKWLNLTLKYSELKVENCHALIAVTRYSKLYVDEGSSIVSESRYDVYRIGKVANFVTSSAYTDFDIEEVQKKLEFENKYGSLKVDYVPASFEEISIDNQYGGVKIDIAPGASYRIIGTARYAGIDYPDTGRVSKIKESSSLSIDGYVGTNENPAASVKIETRYGSIHL